MTRREEIKEGLARALGRWKGHWGDGFQHNYWLEQANLALEYLDSQGVVIKKEFVPPYLPSVLEREKQILAVVEPLIERLI